MSHRQRLLGTLWRYTGHPEHDDFTWLLRGNIVYESINDVVLIVDVEMVRDAYMIKSIHANHHLVLMSIKKFLMTHTQIK